MEGPQKPDTPESGPRAQDGQPLHDGGTDPGSPRENERRLATLLANLPGMAYRCRNDRDWTMEFVSDGCQALTGYKASELAGAGAIAYNSLIHPDDRDRIWNEVQEALGRRVPYRLTYRIATADGREKWVWEQGVGVFSGDQLEALEGFVTDITDRRDAETRLREHNERFRGIIENTDAGYFRIGMDGRYEDVNPAWLRMHRFTCKEEVIGRHLSTVQVPEDAPKAAQIAETLMRGEPVTGGVFSRLRRDGTLGYHTFSANPVLDGDRVIGIEGFLVDISDQRTAEQEKRQTEQRYRALFDSMHEGVALHQLIATDGIPETYRLLDVNRRYEEILGMKREQVVNSLATEAYAAGEAPYLKEYAAVVQTGVPLQFETYFPPLKKHFCISVTPMGGDLFATIFFDVTEQKNTELRYKLISENTADVIWLWSLDEGRCVYVSPSTTKLRGFSPEETMAQSMEEAMPPDAYRMVIAALQRRTAAFASGDETSRIETNEVEFLCKDGPPVATETVTTLLADERRVVHHVIGVSRDITERKRIEEELRLDSELLRNITDGVFLIGTQTGTIVHANKQALAMFGYGHDEMLGMHVSALSAPAEGSPRELAADITAALHRDGTWTGEVRSRKKDGTVFWCRATVTTFEHEKFGQVWMSVSRDITELKRAEKERGRLEEQLRQAQKLESIGRLAGGIAHDFNNLLTVINGYAELLTVELDRRDPLWSRADEIQKAGERAASLTRQLLAFSRKQIIAPKPVNLNTVVRESERMLRRLIGEDIAFATRLDPTVGQVMADPEQVHQVIMNLVVNARDAMPDGGQLDISTTNVEVDDNAAYLHPDATPGRYVMMTVKDTGSGMDEETRQHIFEPFFTTKDREKGTGLGLSTVYGIVRQSGGWIDVVSGPGLGTSFKLYFPRIDGGSIETDRNDARAAEPHGGETILVVEDQDAVRRLTRTMLELYGYKVLEAADGDEAAGVAQRHSGEIHLLLTDVVLPGINGKEVSERLKAMRPGMKTVFTSGYTADVIAHRGVLDAGVAYIPKPFSPDTLATKIREALTGHAEPG